MEVTSLILTQKWKSHDQEYPRINQDSNTIGRQTAKKEETSPAQNDKEENIWTYLVQTYYII